MEIWSMETRLGRFGEWMMQHWPTVGAALCAVAVVWEMVRHARLRAANQRRDHRVRVELEAYGRLDARLPEDGDLKALGKRVCRVVAEVSAFRKVAMLVKDAEGRLPVVGSAGMDDLTVEALNG